MGAGGQPTISPPSNSSSKRHGSAAQRGGGGGERRRADSRGRPDAFARFGHGEAGAGAGDGYAALPTSGIRRRGRGVNPAEAVVGGGGFRFAPCFSIRFLLAHWPARSTVVLLFWPNISAQIIRSSYLVRLDAEILDEILMPSQATGEFYVE